MGDHGVAGPPSADGLGEHFPCLDPASAASGHPQRAWACGHVTPVPASICTWPLPLGAPLCPHLPPLLRAPPVQHDLTLPALAVTLCPYKAPCGVAGEELKPFEVAVPAQGITVGAFYICFTLWPISCSSYQISHFVFVKFL